MAAPRPSTFVTVIAWLALLFSGMAAATGLLQSVIVAFLMPAAPIGASDSDGLPPFVGFVFSNFLGFVVVLTAIWAATFAFAFGLLRRKEWGRKGFVAILTCWSATTAVIAVLQQTLMSDMFGGARSAEAPAEADAIIFVIRIAAALFAVVFAGAFGWLAWRLNSPMIRAEFS